VHTDRQRVLHHLQTTNYTDITDLDDDDDDIDDQFAESESFLDIDDLFSPLNLDDVFSPLDDDHGSGYNDLNNKEVEISDHEDGDYLSACTENFSDDLLCTAEHSPGFREYTTNDLGIECSVEQIRNSEDDCISVSTEFSINAPPHSPISPEVVDMELDDLNMANFFDDFHPDCSTAVSHTLRTPENNAATNGMSMTTNDTSINANAVLQSSQSPHTTNNIESNATTHAQTWRGFKLVGDNLDKNIRPSFQRFDSKTNSLHYFHQYALLDRIDFSGYSECIPSSQIDLRKLLVSTSDVTKLEDNAVILFSRL